MKISRDAVETSYGFCRRMSCRAGSNFHVGFLLLPREKRRAMEALYAFMRHTDDLADDIKPRPLVAPTDLRRDAIEAWRTALERAMQGDFPVGQTFLSVPGQTEMSAPPIRWGDSCTVVPEVAVQLPPQHPAPAILPALADVVQRFHIPHEYLFAVIDGVTMDLDRRRYETFDDLRQYCERVASAVGLACIHVWGFRGPEALEPARQAGIALQLTNILRDLKEDAQAGRVYLPLADLRQCDYAVEDLLAGVADQRFRRVMAMEVARAEQFYAAGAELMDWLEPSGRRIFGLMMATYRSLLRRIASRPADVFHRRVRLGGLQKFQLAARWSLLPPRKADLR